MKFDTIIIGGGLTGLICGIRLQQAGQSVAIVSFGQTLLHFSNGSFSGENPNPEIQSILASAGIATTSGGYRLTPLGDLKPAALTLEGYYHSATPEMKEQSVAIVKLPKYLGLPIEFLKSNLEASGKQVSIIAPEQIGACRAEVILAPACAQGYKIKDQYAERVKLISAMPPSMPGQHIHNQLQQYFQQLGGSYINGDKVEGSCIAEGRVVSVRTEKLTNEDLYADKFILASGSFQSEGLQSNYERIWEPVFGLDVNAPADHTQWTDTDFFADQPYMHYGVCRDAQGHGIINGTPVTNLFPVGHILGGARTEIENLNEALEISSRTI